MFSVPRRSRLLPESVGLALGHLGAVRDGDDETIHVARVEIRRAREIAAVAATASDGDAAAIDEPLKKVSRALGRARDADVVYRLVLDLSVRFRGAPQMTTSLLSRAGESRDRMRRKLVKKLERMEPDKVLRPALSAGRRWFGGDSARAWRAALRRHLADRADRLRHSIDEAGGIDFPERLHRARIATRRLRLSLEFADGASVARPPGARRLLKQAQTALGHLHDLDVLIQTIRRLVAMHPPLALEADMLLQFVRSERARYHAAYIDCRDDLLRLCDQCQALGTWHVGRRAALAAATVALPTAALLVVRHRA